MLRYLLNRPGAPPLLVLRLLLICLLQGAECLTNHGQGVSVAVQHGMTDRQEFQRCTGELSEGPGDDGEGVPGRSFYV